MNNREKIIKKAFKVYLQCGFDGISLNNIIKKMDITKSSFYYYFKDKDDLIQTIREEYLYSFDWEKLKEIFSSDRSTKEKVEEMMLSTLEFEKHLRETLDADINRKDFFRMMVVEEATQKNEHSNIENYNNRVDYLIESLNKDKAMKRISEDVNSKEFAQHIMTCADGLNYVWSINQNLNYAEHVKINIKYLWKSIE